MSSDSPKNTSWESRHHRKLIFPNTKLSLDIFRKKMALTEFPIKKMIP